MKLKHDSQAPNDMASVRFRMCVGRLVHRSVVLKEEGDEVRERQTLDYKKLPYWTISYKKGDAVPLRPRSTRPCLFIYQSGKWMEGRSHSRWHWYGCERD